MGIEIEYPPGYVIVRRVEGYTILWHRHCHYFIINSFRCWTCNGYVWS